MKMSSTMKVKIKTTICISSAEMLQFLQTESKSYGHKTQVIHTEIKPYIHR